MKVMFASNMQPVTLFRKMGWLRSQLCWKEFVLVRFAARWQLGKPRLCEQGRLLAESFNRPETLEKPSLEIET